MTDTSAGEPVTRSSRSWVVSEGHLKVHEARLRSIQELEHIETDLREARRILAVHEDSLARVLRERQAQQDRVNDLEERLRSARRLALYRLSSSSDVNRPQASRGASHDLDDVFLDQPGA